MSGDVISFVIIAAVLALLLVVVLGLVKTIRRERRMRLKAELRFKGKWRKVGGVPRINFSSQGVDAQIYVESSGTRPYVLRATHLEIREPPPALSFILASRDLPFSGTETSEDEQSEGIANAPEGLVLCKLGAEKIDERFTLLSSDPEKIQSIFLGKLRPIFAALDGVAQGHALVVSSYQGKFRMTIGRDLVLEDGLDLFVDNGIALFREFRKAAS